jgi:hypothetical protein
MPHPSGECPRLKSFGPWILQEAHRILYGVAVLAVIGFVFRGQDSVLHALAELVQANASLAGSNHVMAETNATLARTNAQLAGVQIEGACRPAHVFTTMAKGGLKMPDKPDPAWLRPGADGKCREPQTGDRLVSAIVRGTCWLPAVKANPKLPCPDTYYDAPPELKSDPELGNACFKPIVAQSTPQTVLPDNATP